MVDGERSDKRFTSTHWSSYSVILGFCFFSFLSFSPSSPSPFLMCPFPDMSTHQDLSAGRLASSGSREFRSQWICEGDTLTLLLLTNCYPPITFCRQLDWELINLCLLKHLTLCFSDRQEIPVRVWKTDAFNLYFYWHKGKLNRTAALE